MTVADFNERMAGFPRRIKLFDRQWLVCRPRQPHEDDWTGGATMPRLVVPGLPDAIESQPDGLLLSRAGEAGTLDAIIIEACTTIGNFEQHRGRYVPHFGSVVVMLRNEWLLKRSQSRTGPRGWHAAYWVWSPTRWGTTRSGRSGTRRYCM